MAELTVLVLAEPNDPRLRHLVPPPEGVTFAIGPRVEALGDAPSSAEAILSWWGGRDALDPALERSERVRWVHSSAAGVDRLISDTLRKSKVLLTNSRGVFSRSLAEFALGAMLFFAKDFARMRRSQAESLWDPFEVEVLAGKTLGVIGYGDIGKACARLAHALGMKVVAFRRNAVAVEGDPARAEVLGDKLEVVRRADFLLLAAPLTAQTRHIVGAAELAAMKSSAVLLNVGRGDLVDEPALVAALEARRIRGAGLDVFSTEPLPQGHALYRLENVLLSPHCADRTATWLDEAMLCFLENLRRFRAGEPLENRVDLDAGY